MVVVDNPRELGFDLDKRNLRGRTPNGNNGDNLVTNSIRFDRLGGGITKQIIADRKKYIEMGDSVQNGNPEHNIIDEKKITESHTTSVSVPDNYWYDGVLSSFFGGNSCEDRNDMKNSVGMIICGSPNNENDTLLRDGISGPLECGEERQDVDDDSTSEGTMSTLGKDLGDDLKSLPSVHGRILPREEEAHLDDIENLPGKSGLSSRKNSFGRNIIKPREISKHESVESLVEKKINNLKSEGFTREISNTIPYLQQKIFPMTAGRDDSKYSKNNEARDADSALETRRKFLVRELRSAIEKYSRFDVRCANITAALGDLYDENREYRQSLRLHKDVVSVYSANLGDDDKKTLDAKLRLGQVQENSGDIDSAINTYFNIMNMTKALKGEKDPDAMEIFTRIADCLRKKGKYDLSIKIFKRVLKSYREVLGDTHPAVSLTVDSIASLYITIGDYAKASAILEEVVKLKAATLGLRSEEVASSLSELATSYECAKQYSKAMKSLKKAYKIYAEIEGETGEKSILMLERIALVYQATAQYKKAAIAYLGVLRGRKRILGDSHPTVADTYFHLGVSLRESNQQDKAFKCIKQALNIYVGEGKDMHDLQMIAEVMHELAVIHKANNNIADAIKTFQQEIAVRRKLGQPEYPFIAQALNHIGVTEFEMKNYNRALKYFTEAMSIYEKKKVETPGASGAVSGTEYAEALYNTGLVFETLRNNQSARDAFMEAARIFKENGHSKSHPHYSKIVGKLKRLGIVSQDGSMATSKDNPITLIDMA